MLHIKHQHTITMKILKKIGFFSAFIMPSLVVLGIYLGGYWNFLTLAFTFAIIPLIDEITGKDRKNLDEKTEVPLISNELYYRFITYVWAFFQLGFVVWATSIAAFTTLSATEWIGFVSGVMIVTGGIGITVAHELGHKQDKFELFCAKLILMTVCYMHFIIEHNRGHHVHVATPLDKATSKKNQSFYAFWVQSVVGGYKSAWHIQMDILKKKNLRFLSSENEMLTYTIAPILFMVALTAGFSLYAGVFLWVVPVFFVVQSVLGFTMLELVNYIEHYGIVRKQLENGRYERVTHLHSWNASQMVSNFFLFQLQRHSDHHANASRRYQILRHFDESPQLPFGYPLMMLMSLVPPLWFKVMNKQLKDWEEKVYLAA